MVKNKIFIGKVIPLSRKPIVAREWGRMNYEQMGEFSDRCVVGLTDAAYNIQPKVIPYFRLINLIYVYLSVNVFLLIVCIEGFYIKDENQKIFFIH